MALANIPLLTLEKQRLASDPNASVWVSANAGSGKTHVLAQRVVRLLLQGAPPSKILCLTFTKAAAANMASRVFNTLASWTRLDEAKLSEAIAATGAPAPTARDRIEARKLFARTVETPGGLKIQTIHAFCERVLHLFPFEANVPSRFEVADEMAQAELLQRARRATLDEARRDQEGLGASLERVAETCSGSAFESLVGEAMELRALLRSQWPQDHEASLREALQLAPGRCVASIKGEMIGDGLSSKRWSELAAFLESPAAKISDKKKAALFREAAAHRAAGDHDDCLDRYLALFFNKDGEKLKKLLTKGLGASRPDISEEMLSEQERLDRLRDELKAAGAVERTLALTCLTDAIFERYEAIKSVRGVLDFDDLVGKTLSLLDRSEAAWVLYKLDAGIDHILVDEAQDTSAAQWRILERLTGEFAVGEGRAQNRRTFFAVGDEKQSIFSFQGAAPHMFDEMRRAFSNRFEAAKETFAHVRLTQSFRSAPHVLAAVDKVFAPPEHQSGLVTTAETWMAHEALKEKLAGHVEIWPPVAAAASPLARDWRLPLDILDEADPANVVAQRVAQRIARLIAGDSAELVHDGAANALRKIRAGDILVLVRTRGPFFDAVIRALKQNGVPVAGADRLKLAEHIAVLDLIAAGRAALLPEDDLTLAAVLKSPLIGLDDDDLLEVAPRRPGSLFAALGAAPGAKFAAARQKIDCWRARAAERPFSFYSSLLGEDGGRRAIAARLGPEAADAIDEFLRLALEHETESAPSLQGFLCEFEASERQIKRDMETGADVVRVMTVHAAKGLEAKVVFLPDTCGAPSHQHEPDVFVLPAGPSGAVAAAWSPRKGDDCTAIANARETARKASRDEYRRLLYVALTRAEERLYIAGFYGVRKEDDCWAQMIEATLCADREIEEAPAFWDAGERVRILRPLSAPASVAAPAARPQPPPAAAPDWLFRRIDATTEPPAPVRPSSALNAAGRWRAPAPASARGVALRLGGLTHVLLQYLPDLPAPQRENAGRVFLEARAADLDLATRTGLVAAALSVIEAPELAALFGPQSKAEVAVAGTVFLPRGGSIEIAGRIDRLGLADGEALIADFKTGACPTAELPPAYVAQMALYRAALAPLWPEKRARLLLIWTEGPKVVELDAVLLDDALAAIAALAAVEAATAPVRRPRLDAHGPSS